jgi:hypothetical protein
MQGKDELSLSRSSSTTSTPPAPPNTPVNHTVTPLPMTTGPKLITPAELNHYMNMSETGNVFFKAPPESKSNNGDDLDSDFDLNFEP